MKKNIIIYLFGILIAGSSCSSDFLDLVPPSQMYEEEVFGNISKSRGYLDAAYAGVPSSPDVIMDAYTDNAVWNSGALRQAVSGSTAESCPVSSEWTNAFNRIIHINTFFEKALDIPFDAYDEEKSEAIKKRYIGEAYGLRAYFKWMLLKNFAGPSANNPSEFLGYPIVNKPLVLEEVNNLPRATYMQCYNDILTDIDSADNYIDFLRYEGDDDITGIRFTSRVSGEMLWALKARLALYASSPAYEQITPAEAADIIYDAIVAIDGGSLKSLQPYGDYNKANNPDHLWRRSYSTNGNLEGAHLPPILFGNGLCNPTQNLVDAFGDAIGFPIDNGSSFYDDDNPYTYRDPRLDKFVFFNGINPTFNNVMVETFDGGLDAMGGLSKRATRTGYYMQKYLSSKISFNPDIAGSKEDIKVFPVFTREELYLDFAEAAVAAYGITGKSGTMAFSATDVLAIVRSRAGITLDSYIGEASLDVNKLTQLVRNERRLENCFTGERYYDVRRWKLPIADLEMPVEGMKITKTDTDQFSYEPKEVEKRRFKEYMYYNPIPRAEILKSNALIQNNGWE